MTPVICIQDRAELCSSPRIDLNLLVLFHVVYEERHVARAADQLSLTPSAVSDGLGRLRRVLNDPLFLRTAQGVVPSGDGVGRPHR